MPKKQPMPNWTSDEYRGWTIYHRFDNGGWTASRSYGGSFYGDGGLEEAKARLDEIMAAIGGVH